MSAPDHPGRPPGPTERPDPDALDDELDFDDDEALGPPVDLSALTRPRGDPDLLERLRSRIERRQVTGDFARLFWSLPGVVLRGVLWGMTPEDPPKNPQQNQADHPQEPPDRAPPGRSRD